MLNIFLTGNQPDVIERIDNNQTLTRNLSQFISQMEFYFIAEMINMREIQKLYYNLLYNKQNLFENIGNTGIDIIDIVIKYFEKFDDWVFDVNKYDKTTDRVRKYWDEMYQHNANRNIKDKLYYSTFNIDRYHGNSYLNTSYFSRHYENESLIKCPIHLPFPLPSSTLYGVDPHSYDHNQIYLNMIPFPTLNNDIIDTETSIFLDENIKLSNKTQSVYKDTCDKMNFTLYPIDFFRVKHNIFLKNNNIFSDNIKYIDNFQFNLLRFTKLAERLEQFIFYYDEFFV